MQLLNIFSKLVTGLLPKLDKSISDKDVQSLNIYLIFCTFVALNKEEVKSIEVNLEHPKNIYSIFLTLLVSNCLISIYVMLLQL